MKARDQRCVTLGLGRDVTRATADLDLGLDEPERGMRVGKPAGRNGERQHSRTPDGSRGSRPQLDTEQLDSVGQRDRGAQLAFRAGVAELDRIVTDAVEVHQPRRELSGGHVVESTTGEHDAPLEQSVAEVLAEGQAAHSCTPPGSADTPSASGVARGRGSSSRWSSFVPARETPAQVST